MKLGLSCDLLSGQSCAEDEEEEEEEGREKTFEVLGSRLLGAAIFKVLLYPL